MISNYFDIYLNQYLNTYWFNLALFTLFVINCGTLFSLILKRYAGNNGKLYFRLMIVINLCVSVFILFVGILHYLTIKDQVHSFGNFYYFLKTFGSKPCLALLATFVMVEFIMLVPIFNTLRKVLKDQRDKDMQLKHLRNKNANLNSKLWNSIDHVKNLKNKLIKHEEVYAYLMAKENLPEEYRDYLFKELR